MQHILEKESIKELALALLKSMWLEGRLVQKYVKRYFQFSMVGSSAREKAAS